MKPSTPAGAHTAPRAPLASAAPHSGKEDLKSHAAPGPLVVQGDRTLLLEVDHPRYGECRDFLATFAELVKSPEYIHTWRLTPLSLWNAAALGICIDTISAGLRAFARYPVPENVIAAISEWYAAYGTLVLEPHADGWLHLRIRSSSHATGASAPVREKALHDRLRHDESLERYWAAVTPDGFLVPAGERGNLKQALVHVGWPTEDLCGYITGDPFRLELRTTDTEGRPFALRDYQEDAVESFHRGGEASGGSGVIVLPCGSGKTVVGLGAMTRVGSRTLVVTTNNVSASQWRAELLQKTHVTEGDIGLYTGESRQIRPITITTYQMLTHRPSRDEAMPHLALFTDHAWGLIVYDEVHMLPAPVFRATAEIQARRRLGLTATLVREDGREDDVFALIGPKRCDVPWKVLEGRGYIAEAACVEYRIPLSEAEEERYALAPNRDRFRIAAENPLKNALVRDLLEKHRERGCLVIGGYIAQVEGIARQLRLPLITGSTPHIERERLYAAFRAGEIRALVVSKVANFAVDLPDASVLIEVSGTYGSRQEEAQRLGRILRPKGGQALFFTLVSKGTDEQRFSAKRQMFLVEQGYEYSIRYADPEDERVRRPARR